MTKRATAGEIKGAPFFPSLRLRERVTLLKPLQRRGALALGSVHRGVPGHLIHFQKNGNIYTCKIAPHSAKYEVLKNIFFAHVKI